MKKNSGTKFGPKSGQKLGVFLHFSNLVHYFSFKLHRMIAWNNVQLLPDVKGAKKFAKQAKIGSKISFFFLPFSQVWFISFPINSIR